MNVRTFDLFKIGIVPSSSYIVGAMIAACRFATRMLKPQTLSKVRALRSLSVKLSVERRVFINGSRTVVLQ